MMTAKELRQKFLDFFKTKKHTIISSSSLIPENDPTVLFTTAGMHPLVPYLLGEKHPGGSKLANVQKCVRTDDIDEVGDSTHNTFFEMLGNWSLGAYFKKEAIEYSYEFLTSKEYLGLDIQRIAVSVFAGDSDAPRDEEAASTWLNVSKRALEGRIDYLPKNKNWWGPAGQTGPCGPDTEMFYWVGKENPPKSIKQGDLADHPKWVEIWNDVFMQYNKKADGTYESLKQKNVDTGMGLERTLAVLNGLDDIYKTKLFWPIIEKIEELSEKKYDESTQLKKSMRIMADHMRSATFMLGDRRKITPSNIGQGYILRRLIRRAIRHWNLITKGGKVLQIEVPVELINVIIPIYHEAYPELFDNESFIIDEIRKENNRFGETYIKGLQQLDKEMKKISPKSNPIFPGEVVFEIFATYGFPPELTEEYVKDNGFEGINWDTFKEKFEVHQSLSRTGSNQVFKGGLADHSEMVTKLHTATHLLHQALRTILGDHVQQKGSNITVERLRFDFSHPEKMTPEQIKRVENIVNEQIEKEIPVTVEEMTVEEAKKSGALGFFEHKYGEKVKVYTIGDFSKEICGGPHIKNTRELKHFTILKEEASSAGVRRIKAIVE